jgi:NTP pyrophosphatase (non-canonical NTP hydrolase)
MGSEETLSPIKTEPDSLRLVTHQIERDITNELQRQKQLQAEGKFKYTCETSPLPLMNLAILTEEVGEVAHELNEGDGTEYDHDRLRKELIQVAAVTIAWIRALDKVKQ